MVTTNIGKIKDRNVACELGKNFASANSYPKSESAYKIYKEHTNAIVKAIDYWFPIKRYIECLEMGGANGALISDLTTFYRNKGIELVFTNVDQDSSLLAKDSISQCKIVSRLEDLSLKRRYDVVLMRYVLQYNDSKTQGEIIGKVCDALKDDGIFVLHHCGASNEEHRGRLEHIFSDVVSKKLKRNGGHCSTWEEVEAILEANNLDVHTLERYQLSIRDLFKNRYDLTENQDKKLHDLLGVYDFIDYIISVNRKNH